MNGAAWEGSKGDSASELGIPVPSANLGLLLRVFRAPLFRLKGNQRDKTAALGSRLYPQPKGAETSGGDQQVNLDGVPKAH